jgi:hypothetical protein
MAFVVNDRVQEFTTTTGTGTLTLTGSPDGFETFSSAVGNGNTTYYAISSNTTEFEVGIGTVGAGTLSRDTVISSSNSDALVNFSAGTKNVFVTLPASKTILSNDSNIVNVPGAATFAAGTVSLPSITTTGDTNTGIFFPAADTIAFTEGGAEAMRIDSSGNVGIGKSALPGTKLDINGAVNMVDNAWFQFGSKNTLFSSAAVAGLIIQSPTAGSENIIFRTSTGAERMRINNSNNVGIGTSSPDAKLSVNGVASFGDGTALLPSIANFGDLNTGMFFPDADTIAFSEGGVEAMRIDSSGRLLVGTTSPRGTSASIAGGNADVNANGVLDITTTNSFAVNVGGSLSFSGLGNSSGLTVRYAGLAGRKENATNSNYAGYLQFSTTNGATSNTAERMRIDSSGNVLIGTTTSPAGSKELVLGGDYIESVVAIGTVGSTHTITLENGTVQTATLTSATACTFTMPTATAGKSFILLLKQPASGTATTATFTGVKYPASGAPTITATVGKMDILTFVADGTNWYGSYTQGYTP